MPTPSLRRRRLRGAGIRRSIGRVPRGGAGKGGTPFTDDFTPFAARRQGAAVWAAKHGGNRHCNDCYDVLESGHGRGDAGHRTGRVASDTGGVFDAG